MTALCVMVGFVLGGLTGCASIAKGVTQALMERKPSPENKGTCYIRGRSFDGLDTELQEISSRRSSTSAQRLKVLMVHGIGDHQPAYSTRLSENLARSLRLTVSSENIREFKLKTLDLPDDRLPVLRALRYVDKAGSREMVFYELTWDPIIHKEKHTIDFDNSGEYSFRRATFNQVMKAFVNSTLPDALIYQGSSREYIQAAVSQSICQMLSKRWVDLPDGGSSACNVSELESSVVANDEIALITHSLGSRVTLDALQRVVKLAARDPSGKEAAELFQDRRVNLFMLSNQLPLLQMGRELPEVYGQIDNICRVGGTRYDERFFKQLHIVAFSDPNDLFSYAIPEGCLANEVDSRVCPTMTNVIVNVSHVMDITGSGDLANPLAAHLDYDNDDRVIGLISGGLGPQMKEEVRSSCEWLETVDDR
jgi:hypothetical protein